MTAIMKEYGTSTAPDVTLTFSDLWRLSPEFRFLHARAKAETSPFEYGDAREVFIKHYLPDIEGIVGHRAIGPQELRTRAAYNSAVRHILGALHGAENRYMEEYK